MICDHPECTGNHNDRRFATLCPRTREAKAATERRRYGRMSGVEYNGNLLRIRRYHALKRMAERNRLPKEA